MTLSCIRNGLHESKWLLHWSCWSVEKVLHGDGTRAELCAVFSQHLADHVTDTKSVWPFTTHHPSVGLQVYLMGVSVGSLVFGFLSDTTGRKAVSLQSFVCKTFDGAWSSLSCCLSCHVECSGCWISAVSTYLLMLLWTHTCIATHFLFSCFIKV